MGETMATAAVHKTIAQMRRVVLGPDGGGLADGQLLTCFVEHHDEAAFEALVRRLGPMVLGVCRRMIANDHDAEDAFQATFLVLVRKAATVVPREAVANWLYGVAFQTARKGRAMAIKRRAREKQLAALPEPSQAAASGSASRRTASSTSDDWSDLQPILDQELSRLPDKYRLPVVLCDLQGKTRKDAAGQLGCPEGSLSGRLSRARALLARRLTRRGLAISGAALAAAIGQNAASATVPPAVLASTLTAAKVFAMGSAASGHAAVLAEGVLKAMLIAKLKLGALVLVVCGMMALAASVAYSGFGPQPTDDLPVVQEKSPPTLALPGGQPDPKREPIDFDRLQGAWESVSAVRNGEESKPLRFVIERNMVRYPEFVNVIGRPFLADRIAALRPSTPRQIDIEVLSNPAEGKSSLVGIYNLDGDQLTICLGQERPTKFESPKGSGISLFVMQRQKPAVPPAEEAVPRLTDKAKAAPREDYIKAEVRGVLRMETPDRPASAYVAVRRSDREDKVWLWFNEGQWKAWRDIVPKLVGTEVVVRGRIGQMPAKSMASIAPGAMHFEGRIEIESPPGTPR
jgi:RNA polymerase sigma factor (sigma-70 family)